MKKRYLLFAGEDYYPNGGANDLKGSFDTVEEAVAHLLEGESTARHVWIYGFGYDWAHVLDTATGHVTCLSVKDGKPI